MTLVPTDSLCFFCDIVLGMMFLVNAQIQTKASDDDATRETMNDLQRSPQQRKHLDVLDSMSLAPTRLVGPSFRTIRREVDGTREEGHRIGRRLE